MHVRKMKIILRSLANPEIAAHSQRFFKTGKGEYGEGDRFLGIRVPVIRQQVKQFNNAALSEVHKLLMSSYHEERLCALLILVEKYAKGSIEEKEEVFDLYLANTEYINNWDLVDSSAPQIVGAFLKDKDKKLLYTMACSDVLWERRIAIMASFQFIKAGQFGATLKIAKLLLNDDEDLIHKAVGWMLREVGKRDHSVEIDFLDKHYIKMPRTMLRYAIEKFPESERQKYLKGAA